MPTSALDLALWMESDRMGHLLGAITQAMAASAREKGAEILVDAPVVSVAMREGGVSGVVLADGRVASVEANARKIVEQIPLFIDQVVRGLVTGRKTWEEFEAIVAANVGEDDDSHSFNAIEHDSYLAAVRSEHVLERHPGGTIAVTVPRWLPEKVCWMLSDAYHEVEGGHVRIYRGNELAAKLEDAGLRLTGRDHVHGLHSPYWWVKCAVGVTNDDHPLAKAYHRVLVWDIVKRPLATRLAEQVLDPLIGKSMVLYLEKPVQGGR